MLNRFIHLCLDHPRTTVGAGILVALLGLLAAFKLPMDAVPDITSPQVQVNVAVPAMTPEEIERRVTVPLEQGLMGLGGAREIRSLSRPGLAQVTLRFEDGVDLTAVRARVQERLSGLEDKLPPRAVPRLAPVTTGLGEIYSFVLLAGTNSRLPEKRKERLMELRSLLDTRVRPRLIGLKGVAEVNSSGGYEKEVVIEPDPRRLVQASVTWDELQQAVSSGLGDRGVGSVEWGGERVTVRVAGTFLGPEELKTMAVRRGLGAEVLRLGDLCEVTWGSGVRHGTATWQGEEAVVGSVLMAAGENSRDVAGRVHERIEEIRSGLPPGIELRTVYNRMDLVSRTLGTVAWSLSEAAILVLAVLLLLLGDVRSALLVALAIPLSFLMALTGLVAGGVSGNLMSLGAVDFGLMVDGAVVMVDHMRHRLAQASRGEAPWAGLSRLEILRSSAAEVSRPTFFGIAIITVVYLPILSLTGVEGKMFRPMALTVIFALVASLLIAFTLVPVLARYLLRPDGRARDPLLVRWAEAAYRPALGWATRHRGRLSLGALLLFAVSAFLFSRLGSEFMPRLDEGSLAAHMIRTPSIGLEASLDLQVKAERHLLAEYPEIAEVFSRIGTAEIATDPMGLHVSDTYLAWAPRSQWRREGGRPVSVERLKKAMAASLGTHVPGQAVIFSQPIEMRFNELLEGTRADLAVKITGPDFEVLENLALETRRVLMTVPGAAEVEFDAMGRSPILEVRPRPESLARYGVTHERVAETLEAALEGRELGLFPTSPKTGVYSPVTLRLGEGRRMDPGVVQSIPVSGADGAMIPLGELADLVPREQLSGIIRDQGQRRAAIMVNLRDRDLGGFVEEARATLRKKLPFPDGYGLEFGGQYQNLVEARNRLALIVPLALGAILLFLQISIGSGRQTLLILTGIPLALTGGVLALALRGLDVSIPAAIGFIALSGIAVLNGLMMVSAYNRTDHPDPLERARRAALERLRPVLMTALVASIGFVPMALSTGAGADVQRPLATVVIGGVLTSTFLTLVLLPAWLPWSRPKAVVHA